MAKVKGPRMRKMSAPSRLKTLPAPEVRKLKRPKAGGLVGKAAKPIGNLLTPVFNVLGKLVPPYFKNAWAELRQVTWPSRKESWRLSAAVFIFAAFFGLAVAGVDKLLDSIFKATVLK